MESIIKLLKIEIDNYKMSSSKNLYYNFDYDTISMVEYLIRRYEELEKIEKEHQIENGKLIEEIKKLKEINTGKCIREMGVSDLYMQDNGNKTKYMSEKDLNEIIENSVSDYDCLIENLYKFFGYYEETENHIPRID